MFTGYVQLKLFKLSAVRLQPSMDKKWKKMATTITTKKARLADTLKLEKKNT